jgi:hypothetical protein
MSRRLLLDDTHNASRQIRLPSQGNCLLLEGIIFNVFEAVFHKNISQAAQHCISAACYIATLPIVSFYARNKNQWWYVRKIKAYVT